MATHVNITMPVGDTFTHRGTTWHVETNGITNLTRKPPWTADEATGLIYTNVGWTNSDTNVDWTNSDNPTTTRADRAQAIRDAYSAAAQHNLDVFEPRDAITIAHYITTGHTP